MATSYAAPIQSLPFPVNPAKKKESELWSSSIVTVLGLFALHAGLGYAMHEWPLVGTAHGWIVGLVAITAAFVAKPVQVAAVGAYAAGSDVLWRMTSAQVPWEFGKYITVVVLIIALSRNEAKFVWRPAPVLYFGLLLPSILVELVDPRWQLGEIGNAVKFALSGPLVLAIGVLFFSQLSISPERLREIFVAYMAPVAGITAITLVSTYSAASIKWTTESNFVTSGGFGPNQISTVLGLGAMCAFLISIEAASSRAFRWVMTVVALFFLAQSAMTFSRGGFYSAVAGAALASVALLFSRRGDTRGRGRGILRLGILVIALTSAILPRLDQFTGGTLTARLQETDPTGRDGLIRDDIELWSEHPLLGAGPDASVRHRTGRAATSHTEYSRLLAEHGLLGAFALVLLVVMCSTRVVRTRDGRELALVAALLAWSALTMTHASMRTLAPGFVFGLAFAAFPQRSRAGQLDPGSRSNLRIPRAFAPGTH